MKAMTRFLDRVFTVGNMACLMQVLLAIGIASSPITPTGAAARVRDLSNNLITPLTVFVTFAVFGGFGIAYGVIRQHTPITIMIFNFPFLFYGCAVSLQTILSGAAFTGIALYSGFVLIVTAHLWQRTRHD